MAAPTDNGVAIVTGGSHGTGRAIARRLASRGYAVVVVYLRDQAEAEAAVEEILRERGTALAVRADLGDELDVERVFDETAAAFGGADMLVHVAERSAAIVYRQAARRLRTGGGIVDVSDCHDLLGALCEELSARAITFNGLPL